MLKEQIGMGHGIERKYEKKPEGIICDQLNFSFFICKIKMPTS